MSLSLQINSCNLLHYDSKLYTKHITNPRKTETSVNLTIRSHQTNMKLAKYLSENDRLSVYIYTVSQKKTWCRTFCDNFINC